MYRKLQEFREVVSIVSGFSLWLPCFISHAEQLSTPLHCNTSLSMGTVISRR
jgi:hypothetical protein